MSNENLVLLIIKELKNEITEEEQKRLNIWRSNHSDNEEMYQQIIYSWNNAEGYKSKAPIDEQKAKDYLLQEISKPAKVVHLRSKRYLNWVAAASLVGIVALASWLLLNQSQPTSKWVQVTNTTNEVMDVTLPDKSRIKLNEEARLSYLKSFERREVKLEGEAYFDVESDVDKPFTVETFGTKTTVLGTAFNINSDIEKVEVSLFEGKVNFSSLENESVILHPGESAQYIRNDRTIQKLSRRIDNDNSWLTKQLNFDRTEITEVVRALASYYDINLSLNIEDTIPCYFTGRFNNDSFEEVVEVLKFTYDMSVETSAENYNFSITSCK